MKKEILGMAGRMAAALTLALALLAGMALPAAATGR